nr:MAG TPA: hypothetical protein [Caudoviricetes sp.]
MKINQSTFTATHAKLRLTLLMILMMMPSSPGLTQERSG